MRELASRIPDLPEWVELRGMLLTGRCELVGPIGPGPADFAVRGTDFDLFAVSGDPDLTGLAGELRRWSGRAVLCSPAGARRVAAVVPGWTISRALVHTRSGPHASTDRAPSGARIAMLPGDAARSLEHVPPVLREEIRTALGFTHVAAAFDDGRPVSFCYAGYETEKHWDVSIDTLESHRGRGLARECCDFLIDHMDRHGKEPVWGALERNVASRRLAASLGFAPTAEAALFEPPGTAA
jgi:GNAT superfamily N-acetyltransferase